MTFHELHGAMESARDQYELLEIASSHKDLFTCAKWPGDAARARNALIAHLSALISFSQVIDALRAGLK